jgi:hypothetical protein
MYMSDDNDYVVIWEAPVIVPTEFRLYYDDNGHVVSYSCGKHEGNYIVIDALTYAIARPDVRVIDGKISTVSESMVVSKLMPADTGIKCASEDISIVVDDSYIDETTQWKLNIYELR